jgi:hypothetical protein
MWKIQFSVMSLPQWEPLAEHLPLQEAVAFLRGYREGMFGEPVLAVLAADEEPSQTNLMPSARARRSNGCERHNPHSPQRRNVRIGGSQRKQKSLQASATCG